MAGVTEADAARIRRLLQLDTISATQFEEICTLGRRAGDPPPADGWDEQGKAWWRNATVIKWLRGELEQRSISIRAGLRPLRRRTAALASSPTLRHRRGRGPRTWDPATRTCEAIIASETPATVWSFDEEDYIDEILVADGCRMDEAVPLLADHQNYTGATIGRAFDPRREDTNWVAMLEIGDHSEKAIEIGEQIEGGFIDAVSIGYVVEAYERVAPGGSLFVEGRYFKNNGTRILHVVTSWRVHELSIVAVGADPTARIRSQFGSGKGKKTMSRVPAIHSRESITGRPSIGALVNASLLQARISDPTRCRAQIGRAGELQRIAPSYVTERDADQGQLLMGLPAMELIRRALELDGHRAADRSPQMVMRTAWLASQRGSTANLQGLYQGVVTSLMMAGWDAAGDSTEGWVTEADNLTYRQQPASRLSAAELAHVPKGGVAEDVGVELVTENTQVARYGGKFSLDEEDIINASTNGAPLIDAAVGMQLGASARALRPNLIYATLLRNPVMSDGLSLFHAEHGNVRQGDLDDPGLTEMATMIGRQEENSVKLNLRGDYLIVPVERERTAGKLIAEVSSYDDEATRPPIVRSDSRLDNGLKDPLTGTVYEGSETRHYMASRAAGHGLEVRYLLGTNRMPDVRVGFLTDPGEFGIGIDVQMTIGVAVLGYRGLAVCEELAST